MCVGVCVCVREREREREKERGAYLHTHMHISCTVFGFKQSGLEAFSFIPKVNKTKLKEKQRKVEEEEIPRRYQIRKLAFVATEKTFWARFIEF